jgi:GT2 family glycosyltransferase
LIEKPPRFGSKRFREILWPALRGKPLSALSGIFWLVTRRRVRGWSRLLIAASEAHYDYRRWVMGGEKHALSQFRCFPVGAVRILPIIIGGHSDGEVSVSIESLRAAFGSDVTIYATSDYGDACRIVPETARSSLAALASFVGGGGWLLPIMAGDVVAAALADILDRVLPIVGEANLVYWDEDYLGPRGRQDPWIKPDWDGVLFDDVDALAGASVISLAEAQSIQAPALDERTLNRALMTVAAAGHSVEPAHIPLILTHRCAKNALHPKRSDSTEPLFHEASWPTVSIIVATRDRADLLSACLESLDRTSYPGGFELIVVDNGTTDPVALDLLEARETSGRGRVIRDPRPFNFSRMNNHAARIAAGDYLCLLNNDVEATDPDWLKALVAQASGETVGAVGAMLLYPNGRIQHAGVAIGVGGGAGHVQKGVYPSDDRFWTWHAATRQVSAVTAAVLVIKKSKFLDAGGFDETFAVAFNDVDLCLRLQASGLRNIYVANVRLIHRESESRGDDRSKNNVERYSSELSRLQRRWHTEGFQDPHFSPLFSRLVERCVLIP